MHIRIRIRIRIPNSDTQYNTQTEFLMHIFAYCVLVVYILQFKEKKAKFWKNLQKFRKKRKNLTIFLTNLPKNINFHQKSPSFHYFDEMYAKICKNIHLKMYTQKYAILNTQYANTH